MDRLLSAEFWAAQASLVMTTPHAIIALVLLAIALVLLATITIGWKRCGARIDAAETRLEQALDTYQTIRKDLAHLQSLVGQLNEKIKKMKKEGAAVPECSQILDDIANDSAKAKFSIAGLSQANYELGRLLSA
jgi:F0F1-type ATP synthase membrane subunit b/b'